MTGGDPAGGEGAPVADPLDVVDDRHGRVTGPQEVGVQRVQDELALDDYMHEVAGRVDALKQAVA